MKSTQPLWGRSFDSKVPQGSCATLGWKSQRGWRREVAFAAAFAFSILGLQLQAQTPLFAPPAVPVPAAVAPPAAEPTPPDPPADEETTKATPTISDEMLLDAPRPKTLRDSQVIARVNGSVVLACEIIWLVNVELEQRLSTLPAEQRAQIPAEQLEQVRQSMMKQFLLAVIDRKIKYTDFRRNAPQADIKQIHSKLDEPFEEKEIPRLIKAFEVKSVQELEAKLHSYGTSIAEQREMFYEQMIAHSWIREQLNYEETVTHAEMWEYYQSHLVDYEFPTQVRWEELMIRFDRSPGNNWEERKANAYRQLAELGNNLWQRVPATPPSEQIFAELAKSKSHGLTSSEGGIHDWTTQGALKAKAIDSAIFSLAPGQMSEILASEEGFHIVRVLERKDAGRTPFTEVQTEITKIIVDQRFDVAAKEKIDKIRQDARIWTIYDGTTTAEALFARPGGTVRK